MPTPVIYTCFGTTTPVTAADDYAALPGIISNSYPVYYSPTTSYYICVNSSDVWTITDNPTALLSPQYWQESQPNDWVQLNKNASGSTYSSYQVKPPLQESRNIPYHSQTAFGYGYGGSGVVTGLLYSDSVIFDTAQSQLGVGFEYTGTVYVIDPFTGSEVSYNLPGTNSFMEYDGLFFTKEGDGIVHGYDLHYPGESGLGLIRKDLIGGLEQGTVVGLYQNRLYVVLSGNIGCIQNLDTAYVYQDAVDLGGDTDGISLFPLIFYNDSYFVCSQITNHITGYSTVDDSTLWDIDLASQTLVSQLAVDAATGVGYYQASTGSDVSLYAIDLTNGSQLFVSALPSVSGGTGFVSGTRLIYQSASNLYAVDKSTGSVIWSVDGSIVPSSYFASGLTSIGNAFISGLTYASVQASQLPAGTADRTVACWVNTIAATLEMYACDYGTGQSRHGFGLGVKQSQPNFTYANLDTQDFSLGYGSPGAPHIADGNWHLLAVTVDSTAGMVTLYCDNQQIAQDTISSMGLTTSLGTPPVFTVGSINNLPFVGVPQNLGGSPFYGSIQEVLVFNRVLTGSELSSLWNGGDGVLGDISTAPWDNGLVLGFHCNETSGGTLHDFSSYGTNATVSIPGGSFVGCVVTTDYIYSNLEIDYAESVGCLAIVVDITNGNLLDAYGVTPSTFGFIAANKGLLLDGVYLQGSNPAALAGDDQIGYAGNTLTFSSPYSSTGPGKTITTYNWDYGDGNNGSGESTTHTYSTPGQYTVTLIVTDSGSEQDTDTIRVNILPTQTTAAIASLSADSSSQNHTQTKMIQLANGNFILFYQDASGNLDYQYSSDAVTWNAGGTLITSSSPLDAVIYGSDTIYLLSNNNLVSTQFAPEPLEVVSVITYSGTTLVVNSSTTLAESYLYFRNGKLRIDSSGTLHHLYFGQWSNYQGITVYYTSSSDAGTTWTPQIDVVANAGYNNSNGAASNYITPQYYPWEAFLWNDAPAIIIRFSDIPVGGSIMAANLNLVYLSAPGTFSQGPDTSWSTDGDFAIPTDSRFTLDALSTSDGLIHVVYYAGDSIGYIQKDNTTSGAFTSPIKFGAAQDQNPKLVSDGSRVFCYWEGFFKRIKLDWYFNFQYAQLVSDTEWSDTNTVQAGMRRTNVTSSVNTWPAHVSNDNPSILFSAPLISDSQDTLPFVWISSGSPPQLNATEPVTTYTWTGPIASSTPSGIGNYSPLGEASGDTTVVGDQFTATVSANSTAIGVGQSTGNHQFTGIVSANSTSSCVGLSIHRFTAATSANSAAAGFVISAHQFTSTVSANSTASSTGIRIRQFMSIASANSTTNGIGVSIHQFSGNSPANSTASCFGYGISTRQFTSAASANSTASSVGIRIRKFISTVPANSTASGYAMSTHQFTSAASANSTASSVGIRIRQFTATVSANSTASSIGNETGIHQFIGIASANSTASSVGIRIRKFISTVPANSTASGIGNGINTRQFAATANSTASGIGISTHQCSVTAPANSTASGVGLRIRRFPAPILANSTASGYVISNHQFTSTVSANSTASSVGVRIRQFTATVSDNSTASCIGISIRQFTITQSANGTSSGLGISIRRFAAAASANSTVSGVGYSIGTRQFTATVSANSMTDFTINTNAIGISSPSAIPFSLLTAVSCKKGITCEKNGSINTRCGQYVTKQGERALLPAITVCAQENLA